MAFSNGRCAPDGSTNGLHVASCVPNQAFPAQGSVAPFGMFLKFGDLGLHFDLDFDLNLNLNLDEAFDLDLDFAFGLG